MSHEPGQGAAGRKRLVFVMYGLTVAALVAVIIVIAWPSGVRPEGSSGLPTPGAQPTSADFQKLIGDWGREDGDYTLRIRGVGADGHLDAAYLNPKPITVAAAKAARVAGGVQVFVELRDAGYPGCTYQLAYDTANDRLAGIYYQAAAQQRYDVVFARMR